MGVYKMNNINEIIDNLYRLELCLKRQNELTEDSMVKLFNNTMYDELKATHEALIKLDWSRNK